MPKKKEIWNQITTHLQSELPSWEFKTWLSPATLIRLGSDLVVIDVPNKFVADWLREKYVSRIQNVLKKNLNISPEIRFHYKAQSFDTNTLYNGWHSIVSKETLPTRQFDPYLTFENFVTGTCNRFAYFSASEVANSPAHRYNPLLIFGKFSSGKTHLLHAIGNHVLNKNPSIKAQFSSCDRFTADLTHSFKNGNVYQFREALRNLDLFILDDIHLFSQRKKSQQEFILLFNFLYDSDKQIVISSKIPPSQIENISDELKSRLEWGVLSEIKRPDQETKIKIIRKRLQEYKVKIPDDVTFFLANITSDMKTLIANVIRLGTFSSLYNRKIDISSVKSLLRHSQSTKPGVGEIQQISASYFDISLSDLLSDKKRRKYSYPRQLSMYLCRKLTSLSYKAIGEAFGNKDHSTVMHAVNRIEKDKNLHSDILDDLAKLQNLLA